MNQDANKKLQAALAKIEKDFGKGAVMVGDYHAKDVDIIPTGALPLDIALGIGGLPRGRIVEIYGPEASGKTTFCNSVVAQAQKMGGTCAFIDTEHSWDRNYARKLGVNVDELLISQPDSAEQALNICETLVKSEEVTVIIVDSVAALVPQAEINGDIGDSFVGLQARLMGQALRKLSPHVAKTNTLLIFTNQLREKIGVMFGSPETQPGGKALKFYSTVRLDIRRIGQVKEGTDVVANQVRVKVVKNKLASPFKQAEFVLRYGEGFDRYGILIDMGVEIDRVKKTGAFYEFVGADAGKHQGMAKARTWLTENPTYADQLEAEIRAIKLPKDEPKVKSDDEAERQEEAELLAELGVTGSGDE